MELDMNRFSSGLSEDSTSPALGQGLASNSVVDRLGFPTLPPVTSAKESMTYTFKIFRDWRGAYRWMLTDQAGKRLLASRFGFSVLAGAFRDIEVEQASGHYKSASIRDETGR